MNRLYFPWVVVRFDKNKFLHWKGGKKQNLLTLQCVIDDTIRLSTVFYIRGSIARCQIEQVGRKHTCKSTIFIDSLDTKRTVREKTKVCFATLDPVLLPVFPKFLFLINVAVDTCIQMKEFYLFVQMFIYFYPPFLTAVVRHK
jgi:hypothetical protein